jgi:putative transposase
LFEVATTEDEDPVEAVGTERAHPAFGVGVRVRRVNHLDARIEYIACTSRPDGGWVAQQARNPVMHLGDEQPFCLLIHDRDSKFSSGFDEVFRSETSRRERDDSANTLRTAS